MFLVLGDQLFYNNIDVYKNQTVLMIESDGLCKRYRYHKTKLAYVLTCMREFRDYLLEKDIEVKYHTLEEGIRFEDVLKKIDSKITLFEPSDKIFRNSLYTYFKKFDIEYEILSNPNFLTPNNISKKYLEENKEKNLKMQNFYVFQRKRLGILMLDDKPFGGKYSFDEDNRKKIPKNHEVKNNKILFESKNWNQASSMIYEKYSSNPGEINDKSYFPLNFSQANKALDNFFRIRLDNFGDYEDALSDKDNFLYHSILSPCINNGILNPDYILERLNMFLIEEYGFSLYNPTENTNIKLNSIEGYIRQIIGWREWVKIMSEFVYKKDLKDYNFFNSTSRLPEYFWTLELDNSIPYPLYKSLNNLKSTAYNHHIERLMVLANYMTISKTDPLEMYNWFMSMYVDAYQWVMIPNVFGMGSFADGGIYATKPYVAGGNYIKKMSDYKNSKDWEASFTDKFWDFLMENEDYFNKNYRMKMLISSRKKKLNSID